jgi:hypothetical protein
MADKGQRRAEPLFESGRSDGWERETFWKRRHEMQGFGTFRGVEGLPLQRPSGQIVPLCLALAPSPRPDCERQAMHGCLIYCGHCGTARKLALGKQARDALPHNILQMATQRT